MMVPLYWSRISRPNAIALIFPQLTLVGLVGENRKQDSRDSWRESIYKDAEVGLPQV